MNTKLFILTTWGWVLIGSLIFAQKADALMLAQDSFCITKKDSTLNPLHRKRWIAPTIAASTYTLGMTGLYHIWYKNENQIHFHFFNDNSQWRQLDKIGHSYSAYQLGKISFYATQKLGYTYKTSLWAATAGFWLMFPIEIFDGFSPSYGASWGDWVANSSGSLFFISQQLLFKEERIQFKFSFSPSSYANLRPNTLGDNFPSQLLKDYNGQTYWLSSSPSLWFNKNKPHTLLPKWFSISFGYGADEMVYGNEAQNTESGYRSYRTFYVSLDVNWEQIPTERKGLRLLFGALNSIKLPFPTLFYQQNKGLGGHWIYF